jgi:ElaB/YqjD/DUF883 family membrane-anchored ribosome-binding protein
MSNDPPYTFPASAGEEQPDNHDKTTVAATDDARRHAHGGPHRDVLGRVVENAHHTIDRLADRAAPHLGRLEEGVAGAGDRMHERADRLREAGDEWLEETRSSVRAHPLTAVGIAVVVGMMLGRMSR